MNTLKVTLTSSIGRKLVMACTGLFLIVFLLEHLYGNLLLYFNDQGAAFDDYSHSAVHNIIIRIVEVFLFAAILIHVITAIQLTASNNKARSVKYNAPSASGGSSWFSRNMGITGSFVLFFIIGHLYQFFLPYRITSMPEGLKLADMVKDAFQNPVYAALYVAGVTFLAFHLSHALRSAIHTLGLNNKSYASFWEMASRGFAVFIWLGFSSFPVLFYFGIAGGTLK
jgi:succinate dehydrogenase / fumarate reductase cytochrome b subunit